MDMPSREQPAERDGQLQRSAAELANVEDLVATMDRAIGDPRMATIIYRRLALATVDGLVNARELSRIISQVAEGRRMGSIKNPGAYFVRRALKLYCHDPGFTRAAELDDRQYEDPTEIVSASGRSQFAPENLDELSDRLMAKAAARATKDTPAEQTEAAAPVDPQKGSGIYYTPEDIANFVAEQQAPPDDHSQAADPLADFVRMLPHCKTLAELNDLRKTWKERWIEDFEQCARIDVLADKRYAELRAARGPGSNRQRTLGGAEGGA